MKNHFKIAVLPGDGIGPEVVKASMQLIPVIAAHYNCSFSIEEHLIGAAALDVYGVPLPENTIEACKSADAVLLGAVGDSRYDNAAAHLRPEKGLLDIRKELGLYANLRPIITSPALKHISPIKLKGNLNIAIYRELSSGIYYGEHTINEDYTTATDVCSYHKEGIIRITKLAFEAAERRRKKLTLVDKANVLSTSRLWRYWVAEIAKEYPEVQVDMMYVDNAAMQLILNPYQFDVILTENMFGDILSDEASVLVGSLGMLPSASYGKKTALFEPVHGSYPQAAGKNIANPFACIASLGLMCEYLQLHDAKLIIDKAIQAAIELSVVTPDLKADSQFGTEEVANFILKYIQSKGMEITRMVNIIQGQSTIV